MGFVSVLYLPEQIRPNFDRTKSRGPDDTRIETIPGGMLCFHRLAIMGLPDEILCRQKAAFSAMVGHSMVDDLKAYAETDYSDEAFREGCAMYAYRSPFTKESLLYRDIFEKHYPGQAAMIADFWMPNADWEGCKVDDPSASVLSNYGASGK